MARPVCLDTNIIIDILNNKSKTLAIIASLDADYYTTSINVFEGWRGHRQGEETMNLLDKLKILDFDNKSALLAADIDKKLIESGHIIDFRDLFIGAVCIMNEVSLLTLNQKHFERMKKFGLKLINF